MILPSLVSVDWLQEYQHIPNLVLLDVSPVTTINNHTSSTTELQIPGARYVDLKHQFSDQQSSYPNTLPSITQFEEECQKLGINNDSIIIVYDNLGIYTSPRVWWLFNIMGHQNIAVLDGGLPAWIDNGYPTEEKTNTKYDRGNFKAQFDIDLVRNHHFITDNIDHQEALVIDARSADRFNGIIPEPRKGLRSGHISNSINIPYTAVLNNGFYKSEDELRLLLNTIPKDQPLVFSCGSGITACIVYLACSLVLPNQLAIYDGSWTEWAQINP